MLLEVVPYDPEWRNIFSQLKAHLEKVLSDTKYVSIEHVGSTSVPGMWAKSIIDVDIIVSPTSSGSSISEYNSAIQPVANLLSKNGYISRGFMGIPGRWLMKSPMDHQEPMRNTYICVEGCLALRNHLSIKRMLQENEELREEYSIVKRKLAEQKWERMIYYTEGKTTILQKILDASGDFNEEERSEIIGVNEAEFAKRNLPAVNQNESKS